MELLISLLIALVVAGLLYWVVSILPLPPPVKQITLIVCAVILLVWVLGMFTGFGGPHWHIRF